MACMQGHIQNNDSFNDLPKFNGPKLLNRNGHYFKFLSLKAILRKRPDNVY